MAAKTDQNYIPAPYPEVFLTKSEQDHDLEYPSKNRSFFELQHKFRLKYLNPLVAIHDINNHTDLKNMAPLLYFSSKFKVFKVETIFAKLSQIFANYRPKILCDECRNKVYYAT